MNKRKKGYTFIELIVVLCILGLCTLILFPTLNLKYENSSRDLSEGAEDVENFINMCKAISRKESRSSNIFFRTDKIVLVINGDSRAVLMLPNSVKCKWTGNSPAVINLLGYIQDKGTIILKSSDGKIIEVTIKIGTGYVSKKK